MSFTDKQYAIDAMQQAIGALRVVLTDGNEVGYLIRRLEVSIDKLKRLTAEENALSPPPLPDLVQQVASDADLSNADQSPMTPYGEEMKRAGLMVGNHWSGCAALQSLSGTCNCRLSQSDDDTKTRIISRAHHDQFSEAGT